MSTRATPIPGEVTCLLREWTEGDRTALERLLPLVYRELRSRAERQMSHERAGHTLQPTALVHEAYLKLSGTSRVEWRDRAHFFAVAARAMREVLVDHARQHGAVKRGGAGVPLSIEDVTVTDPERSFDLIALDLALSRLAALDQRQSRIVELRAFGGLTIEEAAEVLGCSHATVSREWRHAEVWLHREMSGAR